jgi:hypothetical protein
MASRGTTETAKAYTTSATFSYIDSADNVRTLQTTTCAANDLTTVTFNFPISRVRLAYQGTSSGGTINAEGRGH